MAETPESLELGDEVWVKFRFRPDPAWPAHARMRALLKVALRRFGMVCEGLDVVVKEVGGRATTEEQGSTDSTVDSSER